MDSRLVRVSVHMCPERLTQHRLKIHDKVGFVSMLKDFPLHHMYIDLSA